jgi:hypothetical protein
MNQPDDFTATLKTERLNELAFSFKKTGAMVLALELGLFTLIDEGKRTVAAIAEALDLDEEMIERLVSVCKAMDLIRDVDGSLENFSDVSRYLVKTKPTYFGQYLIYQPISEYDSFKDLAQGRLQRVAASGSQAHEVIRFFAFQALAGRRRRVRLLRHCRLRTKSGAEGHDPGPAQRHGGGS